ncbi:hypothetical protein Bca101_098118 [Brassica carinata]
MEKQTQHNSSQPPIDPPKAKLKRKLDEEMAEENKILLTSLSSIHDNNIRVFIRYEQARIIEKRKEQHQQPPITPISCGQIFGEPVRWGPKLLINEHGF